MPSAKRPLCNGDGRYDTAIISSVPAVGFDGKPYERQVVRWSNHPCPGCDRCKKEATE